MNRIDLKARMSPREELERRLAGLPDLVRRRSRFGDAFSYFVGGREIAHFHGDGRMDVRLTRQRIREMKIEGILDPRVRTRGPSADWATLPLDSGRDVPLAIELVEDAMRTNV
ncbi:MAG: luciferase family protein [Thermoplasmata archaeon]